MLGLYIRAMLRPNWRMRVEIRRRVELWRADHPSWPDRSRGDSIEGTVGMHVRHGDKLTPYVLLPSSLAATSLRCKSSCRRLA